MDQAGESASVTAISPDEAHFYVMGSSDLIGYSLFPLGAVSPRIQLIRGFDDGQPIGFARFALFSPDGRQLLVSGSNKVMTSDRDAAAGTLSPAGSAELPDVDETTSDWAGRLNSTWAADGRLLVAPHPGSITDAMTCHGLTLSVPCGMPFEIVALDPDDLSAQVIIAHAGAPMGGVTVALQHAGRFYLGSFAGDRVGIVEVGSLCSFKDRPGCASAE